MCWFHNVYFAYFQCYFGVVSYFFSYSSAGLDVCEQFTDFNDVFKDEDLLAQKNYWGANVQNNGFYSYNSGQNIQHLVASMVPRYPKHSTFRPKRLSARERNMLKRKAKSNAKDHTKSIPEDDEVVLKNPASSNGASSDQAGAYNVRISQSHILKYI